MTNEQRARESLAKTIHRKNDLCRRNGAEESWDSGYECMCFEMADAILKSEWLVQVQAQARLAALEEAAELAEDDNNAHRSIDIADGIRTLAQAAHPARCIGYPDCDGDLEGEKHSEKCKAAHPRVSGATSAAKDGD